MKEKYNILLYGDSISKGVIYDEEKGRYALLEKSFYHIVKDKLSGILQNAALFGNTITRAISYLNQDILKKKPDVVILEFGGNDCDFDWDSIANHPEMPHQPKTEFSAFRKAMKDTILTLKKQNIIPVLMTLPPLDSDRYFSWITKKGVTAEKNILHWLGSVSRIYWWQEKYNSAILSIAKETSTIWIDIRSAFLQTNDYRQYLCKDGIHPNSKGHHLMAKVILDFIHKEYGFLLKPTV
ncbi:MAG: SGNH/GDSL hydrolase family protein [Caldisericia bacterium]|nr:SGNH/GDSL hydrolase family protein [Caldisericia bacterium]